MAHRRPSNRNASPDRDDRRDIRDPLGQAFLRTLSADFARKGKKPVEMLRTRQPHDYLRLVAAFLPKKFQGRDPVFEDMSDEEFFKVLTAVRAAVAEHEKAEQGGSAPAGGEPGGAGE
jgi:hypothetical protein